MDVEKMTTEALEKRYSEVTEEMAQIKTQLAAAKAESRASGIYADSDWFIRANHAVRMKGREHQSIAMELGKRRKAERRTFNSTVERRFVEIAKRRLDHVLFLSIMQEANEMEQTIGH